MKRQILISIFICFPFISFAVAEEPLLRTEMLNVPYYAKTTDEYQKSQCVLDISIPKDAENLPVLVWFHGGGLTGGSKQIPPLLRNRDIVLVGVGYRLAPKVTFPVFLEDAAASVAWTFSNIETYGGNPKKVFVGGVSAGAYLSAMIGLDSRWLKPYNIEPTRISGLLLLTGQMTTHFHVRKLLNYPQPEYFPMIDENAPLYYLSKDVPPILLSLGDRQLDMPVRVQENEFMAESLWAMKHPHVEFYENKGYDHGSISGSKEAFEQISRFIEKLSNNVP
jgi:acetyl esterase/lipase